MRAGAGHASHPQRKLLENWKGVVVIGTVNHNIHTESECILISLGRLCRDWMGMRAEAVCSPPHGDCAEDRGARLDQGLQRRAGEKGRASLRRGVEQEMESED